MRSGKRPRRGATLLEAIAAMSILAVAGIAAMQLVREAAHTAALIRAVDEEVARASAFLDAVALWPEADLDRHLGARIQGQWRMYVEKSASTYRVALVDTASGRSLLETVLYRRPAQAASAQ